MNRRRVLQGVAAGTLSAIAGCLGDEEPEEPEDDDVELVLVTEDGFDPLVLEIEPGEAVTWRNDRDLMVQISSSESAVGTSPLREGGGVGWQFFQSLDSGELMDDSVTFEEEGIYLVGDTVDTGYQTCGAIVVGDYELDEDELPCA